MSVELVSIRPGVEEDRQPLVPMVITLRADDGTLHEIGVRELKAAVPCDQWAKIKPLLPTILAFAVFIPKYGPAAVAGLKILEKIMGQLCPQTEGSDRQ